MAYSRELDDMPRELRKSVSGTIRYFPKVDGANVTAHATAGNHSFTVHEPDGTLIETVSSITPTTVSTYSRLDLAVSAITTLDEGYQIRLTWTDSGSAAHYDIVLFDVVLWPFDQPLCSMNDLVDERPEIFEVLERLGVRRGLTARSEAEEMAGVFIARSHLELYTMIRNQIRVDQARVGSATGPSPTRPNLVLNRLALRRVEVQLALAKTYEANSRNPEDETEETAGLYRHYRDMAKAAWDSIGPLQYDAYEDLTADEIVTSLGRSIRLRRVQS